MRLIEEGRHRAVVSAAACDGAVLAASPYADVSVRVKPVVQSARVLPIVLSVTPPPEPRLA